MIRASGKGAGTKIDFTMDATLYLQRLEEKKKRTL